MHFVSRSSKREQGDEGKEQSHLPLQQTHTISRKSPICLTYICTDSTDPRATATAKGQIAACDVAHLLHNFHQIPSFEKLCAYVIEPRPTIENGD